jgi:hypothetical protein
VVIVGKAPDSGYVLTVSSENLFAGEYGRTYERPVRSAVSSHIDALSLVAVEDSRNSNQPATADAAPGHKLFQFLISRVISMGRRNTELEPAWH